MEGATHLFKSALDPDVRVILVPAVAQDAQAGAGATAEEGIRVTQEDLVARFEALAGLWGVAPG